MEYFDVRAAAVQQLVERMSRRLDDEIRMALDAQVGVGAWTLQGLKGHLTSVIGPDRVETMFHDDLPLLRVWPIAPVVTPGNWIACQRHIERLWESGGGVSHTVDTNVAV